MVYVLTLDNMDRKSISGFVLVLFLMLSTPALSQLDASSLNARVEMKLRTARLGFIDAKTAYPWGITSFSGKQILNSYLVNISDDNNCYNCFSAGRYITYLEYYAHSPPAYCQFEAYKKLCAN